MSRGAIEKIEVISAGKLVWRLRKAGPEAGAEEQSHRERTVMLVGMKPVVFDVCEEPL